MGHKITRCLLVKLFALHTTRSRQIFSPPNKKSKKLKGDDPELQRLSNATMIPADEAAKHVQIASPEITLCCTVAYASSGACCSQTKAMGNNTIKTHLVLQTSAKIFSIMMFRTMLTVTMPNQYTYCYQR